MSPHRDDGFTLVEAMVAGALALVAAGGVLVLVSSDVTLAATTPEAIDLQQRARGAMHALAAALEMAGAGPTAGPAAGPLAVSFAPVLPRRLGLDPADSARDDAVTTVAVPFTRAQTALAAPLAPDANTASVAIEPHCPIGVPACGFAEGTSAVVFDGLGAFDVAAVTAAEPAFVGLRRRLGEPGPAFSAGAAIVQAEVHAYYWDRARRQLRHHDGDRTDAAVVDHVVAMSVEYYGDGAPPARPRPPVEAANCLYDVGHVLRPELVVLAPPPFTLVRLTADRLRDGPWCGSGGARFDADLLRVRSIRVRLTLQAGRGEFRARSGHVVPGVATRPASVVPDLEIAFDIAPRNLAVTR
jgi:hypothetical protein